MLLTCINIITGNVFCVKCKCFAFAFTIFVMIALIEFKCQKVNFCVQYEYEHIYTTINTILEPKPARRTIEAMKFVSIIWYIRKTKLFFAIIYDYIKAERILKMIKADDLFFSYTGSPPYVLNGITLDIRKGEYVSVVGENGSGKSTLMRVLLKFMKPSRGSIVTLAERIGYVPQKNDFSNSNFPITVYEVLNSYRKLLKLKDKSTITENLQRLGMSDFTGSLMGNLSGGQSQKIMIARALMGNPDLLVLDEPSTGVDIKTQREIYSFLKKINKENGITILSVEHNLDAAISNSTLIYHMMEGQGHLCTPMQYADEFLKITGKVDDSHV